MAELTPMMQQYIDIKNQNPDYILLYRLGDFYEMFFDDAILASRELELTLTGRDCGMEERAPMCGMPYHSVDSYIARLVHNGHKVAICEQMEDPKNTKGIVRREITRRVTPGTVIDPSMLDETRNNFLGCIYVDEDGAGACFTDISTGEVYVTGSTKWNEILNDLGRFSPSELLLGGQFATAEPLNAFLRERLETLQEPMPEEYFLISSTVERVSAHFALSSLDDAGLSEYPQAVQSLGGLLVYIEQTQKPILASLNQLQVGVPDRTMELDLTAQRNLELCETLRSKEKKGSLLWVLDQTQTAMGSRLIRKWLEKPLYQPLDILRRQQAVSVLCDNLIIRSTLTDILKKIFDIERLISRVVYGTANGRDLRSLAATIEFLPEIRQTIQSFSQPLLRELTRQIDLLDDIHSLIIRALVDEPPISVRDGGLIRSGYHEEVDSLRDLATGGKGKIAAIERSEREKTGIKNLKTGYNRVFGYYIEVSRSHTEQIPSHYVRKQTLANSERYITEELKQLEGTVLGAQERLTGLEYDLFVELREKVAAEVNRVQQTAQAIATLDVLCALATVASENHYVCPTIDHSGRIDIQGGRHPVVEKMLTDSLFIPNDTILDKTENRVAIITGPNMAGKSTYMRQIALIVIMAQMGSFVPAASAHIGVVDRVFTRIGASDDLTGGQSTFMVEMREVAEILRYATRSSLLVLDEIGRGTSTYDGMSIARAVIEHIADKRKLGARTLFATHYHELTALEEWVDGVKNYNVAVKKRGDDITFLRKIVRGGADDSYGIAVAKLAGISEAIIRRAKTVLANLEASAPQIVLKDVPEHIEEPTQVTFTSLTGNSIAERLRKISVETLTPIEALNLLYELKKMV